MGRKEEAAVLHLSAGNHIILLPYNYVEASFRGHSHSDPKHVAPEGAIPAFQWVVLFKQQVFSVGGLDDSLSRFAVLISTPITIDVKQSDVLNQYQYNDKHDSAGDAEL